MAINLETLAAAMGYTKRTVVGGGAVKGKNCTVELIEKIEGYTRIHFQWTLDDGTVESDYADIPDGVKGDRGDRGAIGPQGLQGIQGVQGETGLTGAQGPQGIQGVQGPQGVQGIQGPKGDDGYPFLIYKQYDDISEFTESDFPEVGLMFMVMQEDYDPEDPTQSIGYPIYRYTGEGTPPYSLVVHLASQGIKGEKGDKGDTGAQGPQGIQGEQGEKGEKGEKGDTGAQGIQGEQGVGLPDGGTTGQVLIKYSNGDYDFDWRDTTDRVQPGNRGLVESQSVYSAIQSALSSIYTPRGDLTCAELTSSLLVAANVGNVYEMTDAGETTALFLQGAGETISIGANVGIISAGEGRILFNLMPGAFDLSDYQKKDLASAVEGAATVEGALGALSTNKADKVASATAGDIASLDANGNLVDSGVVASSVIRRVNPSTAVDCNDLTDRFTEYRVGDGDANRPTTDSNAYIIRTFKTGAASTTYSQIAYQIGGTSIYRRHFNGTTWSSWDKLIGEGEFKSYGIKTIWQGSKTKGDTGMNFDASPYDLCFAQVGGTLCQLISGMGTGTTGRKKFTTVYAGRDHANAGTYEQYYLLDIMSDGTVATCGWFDVTSKDTQNARLAGQKALDLALAGTSTWTDPTWKTLVNVETNVNVSKIIGIKFQTKS